MRVAETSKLRAGSVYKKTYVYFTICECENCRKRFNVKRKDYDFCVRAGRTIGKFCSMKCRRAFHKKKICAVDNCKAKPVGKYCSRHYRRFEKLQFDNNAKKNKYKKNLFTEICTNSFLRFKF